MHGVSQLCVKGQELNPDRQQARFTIGAEIEIEMQVQIEMENQMAMKMELELELEGGEEKG